MAPSNFSAPIFLEMQELSIKQPLLSFSSAVLSCHHDNETILDAPQLIQEVSDLAATSLKHGLTYTGSLCLAAIPDDSTLLTPSR